MSTVKGQWVFNDTLTLTANISSEINFNSNSAAYIKINIISSISSVYYIANSGTVNVYESNMWKNEAYKTIDFGDTEQTVSDDFYNWLSANATPSNINDAKIGVLKALQVTTQAIKKYTDSKDTELKQSIGTKALLGTQEIDASTAYVKDVPADTAKYASINKIGGMTYKKYEVSGIWEIKEVTTAPTTDISQAVSFTSSSSYAGMYVQADGAIKYAQTVNIDGTLSGLQIAKYNDGEWEYSAFRTVDFGSTVQEVSEEFYDWFFVNATIQDGTGAKLESAKVTEMKSVGVNLIRYPYLETNKTADGVTFTDNGNGSVTANGTATGSSASFGVGFITLNHSSDYTLSIVGSASNLHYQICFYDTNNNILSAETIETGVTNYVLKADAIPANAITMHIYIKRLLNDAVSGTFYPMLNEGTEALPYTPYMESTLPIPEAVQALDGYGWGINADCYNYVDWKKKQFAKRVKKVVLDGSDDENWIHNGTDNNLFYISNPFKRNSRTLCDKLPTGTSLQFEKDGLYITSEYSVLYLNLPSVSSIENSVYYLRAWLAENPLTVIGELAEPIITDISDLLPEDNFIEVEGNGSITAVNEYGYDVPSEIAYNTKNNEQVNANLFVGDLIGSVRTIYAPYKGETAQVSEFYFGETMEVEA